MTLSIQITKSKFRQYQLSHFAKFNVRQNYLLYSIASTPCNGGTEHEIYRIILCSNIGATKN